MYHEMGKYQAIHQTPKILGLSNHNRRCTVLSLRSMELRPSLTARFLLIMTVLEPIFKKKRDIPCGESSGLSRDLKKILIRHSLEEKTSTQYKKKLRYFDILNFGKDAVSRRGITTRYQRALTKHTILARYTTVCTVIIEFTVQCVYNVHLTVYI